MVERLEQLAFLAALILITILFGYVLKPFFAPILWACIIAVLFHPLQVWLENRWGSRPNLTALTTLTACVVLVVIPVLLLLTSFVQQGIAFGQRISSGEIQFGQYIDQVRLAFPAVQSLLERFDIDMSTVRENAANAAVTVSQFMVQNAVSAGIGNSGTSGQYRLALVRHWPLVSCIG
ncbi:MAG: AI-2E family transporter [Wenzhouxiangellaceae bacterium]